MTTQYVTTPVRYKFDNKDAKGIVEIIPDAFGVSILVDGKTIAYLDLFYKSDYGKSTVKEQFAPSEEDYNNGYITKPMDEYYYEGKTICRVIPIDEIS